MIRLFRLLIGIPARGVFWAGFFVVVGNAVAQAIRDERYVLAVFEVVGAPFTFLLYPFLHPAGASAWPWVDGTSLLPVMMVAAVAYLVSTTIGGMRPLG